MGQTQGRRIECKSFTEMIGKIMELLATDEFKGGSVYTVDEVLAAQTGLMVYKEDEQHTDHMVVVFIKLSVLQQLPKDDYVGARFQRLVKRFNEDLQDLFMNIARNINDGQTH